jgi:hypothetical protein
LIDKQEAESDAASKTIQVNPKAEKKPTPTPTPTKEAPTKKITKRGAQESKAPPRKRQKKEATPSEEELSDLSEPSPEESEVSESEFDEDSDEPKRKRNSKSKSKTPVKRGSKKKADTESDEEEEDEDPSDETELSDSDDSTAKRKSRPKPKAKAKAPATRQAPAKRQSKSKAKVESSDEGIEEDNSPKKAPAKRQSKSKAKLESSEDEEEEEASPKKATPKKAPTKKETPKKAAPFKGEPSPAVSPHKKAVTKKVGSDSEDIPKPAPDAGSESEMSIVLDEEPKPKRKRRSKSDMAADPKEAKIKSSSNKPGRPKSSSGSAKPPKDLTADEASIKTLQSQLKKCGMNKIWQFELKQYGDDSKEKIKHLQRVMKNIGMSGRFSEARAREIKEMRELQAELEAVKEGEKSWGLGGKRASRAAVKAKSFRESSGSGVDDGDQGVVKKGKEESADEGEKVESEDEQPVPRRPSARADLAFLDDEEESD